MPAVRSDDGPDRQIESGEVQKMRESDLCKFRAPVAGAVVQNKLSKKSLTCSKKMQ